MSLYYPDDLRITHFCKQFNFSKLNTSKMFAKSYTEQRKITATIFTKELPMPAKTMCAYYTRKSTLRAPYFYINNIYS